ncbi:MAG: hypothetical protein WBA93_03805 [Microcoleaceae cyanobacterium]
MLVKLLSLSDLICDTEVANTLLTVDKSERRQYTSKDFHHVEIGSMWIN